MIDYKFDDKNVWFTSDTHYYHKNIVKGVSNWSDKSGCRDFKDQQEMSNEIVDQINKNVMPDDILFHLGDWSFGGIQNIWNFRKRLNVKNIFLSLGNHDNHIYKNKELPNASFNHSEKIQAKDLFVDVQHSYNIQVHDQKITLCHYSMRTWYFHNKSSWMLFGHSHDTLHPSGKTMDVGVDVAYRMFGEYKPFKFQEIQKIMSKKDVKQEDHHSDKTNAR